MGKKLKVMKTGKMVSFLTAVIMILMMFAVNPIEAHAATNAAAPEFSPIGGEYPDDNTLSVTITSPKGGDIYYTLDESEPTTSSTKYTEAIEVSASTTIKAIAVVDGMDNSQVASMTYTISHNHVKSSKWEKDEDNHWHECTKGDGYVFEDSKTTHSYDEGVVTIEEYINAVGQKKYTCTICSYEKYEIYHTHAQISRWDNDSENHWHKCRLCPLKMSEAKHIVTAWTVTQEATETEQGSRYGTCDVCGYRVEQVIPVKKDEPIPPEKKHEESSERNKDTDIDPMLIYIEKCMGQIRNAKEGDIIIIDGRDLGIHSFSLPFMKVIAENRKATIILKYRYNGVEFETTIPAGAKIALNENIPWYGPLYIYSGALGKDVKINMTKKQ